MELVHRDLLQLLSSLSSETVAANDGDFGLMTETVNACGGQQGITE